MGGNTDPYLCEEGCWELQMGPEGVSTHCKQIQFAEPW